MGDIADELLERGEWNGFEHRAEIHAAQCRSCGALGLEWVNRGSETSPRWHLVEPTGEVHSCSTEARNRQAAEDFS